MLLPLRGEASPDLFAVRVVGDSMDGGDTPIRDGDWKLVAGWDGPADLPTGGSLTPPIVPALKKSRLVNFELYNLRDDVGEQHDRSTDEPERLAKMIEAARAMYAEVIAEGPVWEFP